MAQRTKILRKVKHYQLITVSYERADLFHPRLVNHNLRSILFLVLIAHDIEEFTNETSSPLQQYYCHNTFGLLDHRSNYIVNLGSSAGSSSQVLPGPPPVDRLWHGRPWYSAARSRRRRLPASQEGMDRSTGRPVSLRAP